MSINTSRLIATLESLSSTKPIQSMSLVMDYLKELSAARESALIKFDIKKGNGASTLTNITVAGGSLREEAINRLFVARAEWWAEQLTNPMINIVGQLIQTRDASPFEAFRYAYEPLILPKLSALIVAEKAGVQTMSAVVTSDFDQVPPASHLAVFHSLATTILRKCSYVRQHKLGHSLTDREKECLVWSARGKTSLDIAEITGLSENTVNHYLANATTKLNASNRTNAIIQAIMLDIIPISEI